VFERKAGSRVRRASTNARPDKAASLGGSAGNGSGSGFSLSHDMVIDACIEAVDRASVITDDRSGKSIAGRRLIHRAKQRNEERQIVLQLAMLRMDFEGILRAVEDGANPEMVCTGALGGHSALSWSARYCA